MEWTGFFNTFKVNKVVGIHFDAQFRTGPQAKQIGAILLRPGVNITFRKDLIGTVGYALIENRREIGTIDGFVPEQRVWQQLQLNHPLLFTTLSHRLRFEERFISRYFLRNNEIEHEGSDFTTRLRYFVRDVIPFSGQKTFDKGMFASVQDEIFINTGDKTPINGKVFDQNRLLLGLGWRFSKKFDLEASYLNQYISGKNKSFTNNHIVQFATYLRL